MADGLFGGGGAAFGVYPQMGGRRRIQDPQGSADVPLQALIGRLAGLLGAPAEVGNIVRSPQPMEMFGDVNYDPQTQLPYDTKYFNQRLPLQPTSRAGELAREAGSFVPLNPMPAVRAGQGVVRMAGQEITDVMSGLPARSALGAITPQPMFAVSPINLNKGIYKPDLTMEEMLKVKDIPTVDRVRQSIDLVGEKEFEKMVNAQYSKYKPSDVDQEAMLVESVTLDILGKAQRNVGKTGLPSPQSLTMPSVPTVEQMQKYGRTETVPLSKAVSFQSARNWEKFNTGKGPGDLVAGYGDKPLALRLETGEYVIYDGNHRTDLALQKGQTELPMHVIDVKSYDPAHAGRKPVPPSMTDDELLNSLLGNEVQAPRQVPQEISPAFTDPFGNTIGESIR